MEITSQTQLNTVSSYLKEVNSKTIPRAAIYNSKLLVDPSNNADVFVKKEAKKEHAFFKYMKEISKPYSNGDGKLTIREALINFVRGCGVILTEVCTSPKKLAIATAATAVTVGAGVGLVTMGVVSAHALLLGVGVVSTGVALFKLAAAIKGFWNSNGNEHKLAKAYFHTGEAVTDAGIAALAFIGSGHAIKLARSASKSSEATEVGALLSDNGAFLGSKISETAEAEALLSGNSSNMFSSLTGAVETDLLMPNNTLVIGARITNKK